MRKVELLAPAGNRECLETAFYFGADAAYMAGKDFGLRAFAANFSDGEIENAAGLAHKLGKKLYVTVNSVIYGGETEKLAAYLTFLDKANVDGVIFSDPAVLSIARRDGLKVPLHLSTQANTTNHLSAALWHELGVSRVVLSRELSLNDIKDIRKNTPPGLELEAFVHGSMCIAYSGRCLMSAAIMGRSGNRGECGQPCRWKYHIYERGYGGEYFPIEEDAKGTYILNSKDLMMIGHIPELVGAGITSFKIEGRMKSAYYVASVVSAYRRAVDAYYEAGEDYAFDESLTEELVKSAARGFCTGFFFGNPMEGGQDITREKDERKYTFAAKVMGQGPPGFINVEQRNRFYLGETLEILSPRLTGAQFTVTGIVNGNGGTQLSAPHPQQKLMLRCPYRLERGDILRRHD